MQQAGPHPSGMPVIAILRTLVVTLGLVVLSQWHAAETRPGTHPPPVVSTCLDDERGHGAAMAEESGSDASGPAVVVALSGDTSPDDACEPYRTRDVGSDDVRPRLHDTSRPRTLASTGPDGVERPPKAG